MLPNQARSPFAWISGESIALIATLLALLLEEFYGHAQMFAALGQSPSGSLCEGVAQVAKFRLPFLVPRMIALMFQRLFPRHSQSHRGTQS